VAEQTGEQTAPRAGLTLVLVSSYMLLSFDLDVQKHLNGSNISRRLTVGGIRWNLKPLTKPDVVG
jgi:hypothetical protein